MQLQHQATHRKMVLLSYILYTNQIHGGIISIFCSLFILSLHALALHLAVKILLQIFLYEDLSTLVLHMIRRLYFLQNASRTALCYANHVDKETFLIFDINHQQNTKEVRPDWTIKTIMQTMRPRITWKVLPMALRLPFLKKYSIKCEKI